MPTIYHTFPLNFKYNRGCMQQHKMLEKFGGGVHEIYKKQCFPVATFPLAYADNYKLLQIGQAYSIVTKLEIPETPQNMEIGSFMVIIDIKGVNETKGNTDIHKEKTLQKKKRGKNRKAEPLEEKKIHQFVATKSVSLSYKSPLIRLMNFAIFWPLFLFDFYQETQTFDIVLFDKLELNPAGLNWTAHVYIDHPSIMVNSAQLDVTAQFSGIQAVLYRWPVVSFFVGTAALFPAVLFTVLLSLYFLVWQVFFTEEQIVVSRRSRRPANLVAGTRQLASRNDDDDVIDQPADVTTQCDDSVHDDPAQDDVFNGSFVM
uniref:Seipin n=1 Tax=Ciona savignyi TaxID=51511 RepID=H2ZDF9_CIOSA